MAKSNPPKKNQPEKRENTGLSNISLKNTISNFEGCLSIIVPLGNRPTEILLQEIKNFQTHWKQDLDLIIVGDVESKKTDLTHCSWIHSTLTKRNQLIHAGLKEAKGSFVLLADPDFGTSLTQILLWLHQDPQHNFEPDTLWVGSRMEKKSKTTGLDFSAKIFQGFVELFTQFNGTDSQSHFCLGSTPVIQDLYEKSQKGTDLSLLQLASLYQIPIESKPIEWEKPASVKKDPSELFSKKWDLFTSRWLTQLAFFFIHPFQDAKKNILSKESPWFRLAYALSAFVLFIVMTQLSFDYGITGDEVLQKNYGDDVLAYYESGGKNKKCLEWELLAYYGGLFDYLAAWCNKYIGGLDIYDMRHLLNSIFGFVIMLYGARISRLVSGKYSVALLTLILLALSPRLFGDSMNNPKDIPFATGFVMSVYYMLLLSQQLPRPSVKSIVMLFLSIGITINVRSGGIILLPYLAVFMGMTILSKPELRSYLLGLQWRKIFDFAFLFFLVIALGYWAGTWFWPYAQQDILKNPFIALNEMTKYSVGIRMLWEGRSLWSDELPWYYIPQWLIMSSPLIVLAGFPLSVLVLTKKHQRKILLLSLVAFAGIFPVAYAIYQKSSLYDGMRHFLFVYPMLVVVSAQGLYYLSQLISNTIYKFGIALGIGLLCILPLKWLIISHPHQYVYFNEAFGGIEAAYGKYETDYWMNSMRPICEWFIENEPKVKKGEEIIVATNCVAPVEYYFSKYKNIKLKYVRYHERVKADYDYLITYSRFLTQGFMKNKAWPNGDVVYVEQVNGVPLGCITKMKNRNLLGLESENALKQKDISKAVSLLEQIVKEDPKNESALMSLVQLYPNIQAFDKMKWAIDQVLLIADDYVNALGMKGVYYLNTSKADSAKICFQKAIDFNYKYTFGYFYLASLEVQNNNPSAAISYLLKFDEYGGQPAQGYDLAIQTSQQLKNQLYELYFTAKKLAITGKSNEAYNLIGQVLTIDPNFEPAKKLKKSFDDAMKAQQIKEENRKNGIQ